MLLTVAAVLFCAGLSGCHYGEAPGLTRQQVHMRHYDTIINDQWQIQDDIDAVFLFDRPGRRSQMMIR